MYSPPELATWIQGQPERSAMLDGHALHDPNDGTPVQESRSSSAEQVERAIAIADRVHLAGAWQALGIAGRADHLLRWAEELDARVEQIAVLDAVNSGVPVATTRLFAASLKDTVRQAVRLAAERGEDQALPAEQGPVRLRRVPWGPTALIIPWNAASAVAVKKMAYALVSGAPVVVKPSPASPWSAQLLADAARVLPAGVVGVVLGGAEVGGRLCADPRIKAISMTGSTPTGRAIATAAAPHLTRLRLELGSTNPVVVRADVDVAAAARSLFDGMTKLNGQWCEAPRAVFVVDAVHNELLDALGTLVSAVELGSSLDDSTVVGPMAFEARREELEGQRSALLQGGCRLVASAPVPDKGWFFGPTLVGGPAPDLGSEVFGPLLTVEAVRSDDEAIARANAVAGGLAAYLFSSDIDEALALGARLTGGEVKVNGTSLLDMSAESAQSFFGSSGVGGHGDRDVLDFYSGKQVVGRDLLAAPM